MTVHPISIIRPLSLGQLLDRAIRLYRLNFLKFIGIIAIVQIPVSLLQIAVTTVYTSSLLSFTQRPASQASDMSYLSGALGGAFGIFVVSIAGFILVQVVGTAALTRSIVDNFLGEPSGILNAYRKIGSVWLRLLAAVVLISLLSLLLLIWTIVPCAGWLTGPSALVFLGLVIMPLVTPVVIVESKSASIAIRRAWDLARRRFWWVLGFVFVLYLFSQMVITGPTLLINLLLQGSLGRSMEVGPFSVLNTVIQSIVAMISSLLYTPLQLTAITLMYLDLRVRTEGLDLALQAGGPSRGPALPGPTNEGEGAGEAIDLVRLLEQAPEAETSQLITTTEFGYLLLMSVLVIVLYFLIFGGCLGLASLTSLF